MMIRFAFFALTEKVVSVHSFRKIKLNLLICGILV